MQEYVHEQPGTLLRVALGLWVVVFGVVAIAGLVSVDKEAALVGSILSLSFVIIVALFHSFMVRVSRSYIVLSFGVGLIQKRFVIDEIETSSIVQNRWYNGWGIRWIRGGWLYNASGFDAVEIRLMNS